jgi:hypothetical protein
MTFTRTDSAVPMQRGGLLVLLAACLGIAGALLVWRNRELGQSAAPLA